jgi:hypothetical protein
MVRNGLLSLPCSCGLWVLSGIYRKQVDWTQPARNRVSRLV